MNSLKFCSANEHHVRTPTRKSEGRKFTELCACLTSAAKAFIAQLIHAEPKLPLMMTFFLSCSCVKWQGLRGYQCCCCFAFNVKRFFSHLHFEVAAYGKYINITFLISFVLKADTHSTIQLSGKIQTPNTFHCSDNYHRFPDRTLFKFGWNMFHFDLQVELRFTKVGD